MQGDENINYIDDDLEGLIRRVVVINSSHFFLQNSSSINLNHDGKYLFRVARMNGEATLLYTVNDGGWIKVYNKRKGTGNMVDLKRWKMH